MAEELRTSCALYAYSAAARSCSEGVVTVKALHAEAPRAAAGGESGEKPAKALRVERAPSAEAATTEGAAGQKAAKTEAPAKKNKPKPPRLTHFFALRVAPDALRETAGAVQTALVEADKDLAKCVISPEKFHVTLGLLSLGAGDPDARQRAEAALLEAAAAPPPTVVFPGLDSFGDRVLFAKVEDASGDGRLAAVAAASKLALEAHGFPNQPDFAPHMTLAKTSKARTRRRLKIPKTAWAALADAPAADGAQTLGTIELMAMAGDDGNGGYPVVAAAPLGGGELVTPSDGATVEVSAPRSKRARWKRNARARRAAASEKTV
jgi:2'-5' RNA ligase